ncbi:hypothetical protein DPMN_018299 [Dreissena polymorpha]|uniref:Uncharacterized protein n=3 Tax=Dreissena polymorpha TaxID=45954 RepID=A0A9D4NGB3_DREPO|nr:hypothetical protein DPMN_018299 [Dreissena polymorpha]
MTTDLGVATRKKKDFEGVKQVNAQKLKETRPKKVALNEENLIKFTWLEKGDKTLSSLLVHAKSKQGREQGEIVIEGKKTVLQALSLGLKIKCLFFSGIDKLDFLNHVDFKDVSVYKTSFKNLRVWTELSEPEGFIGIFQKPKDGEVLQPLKTVHPVTLICDRVMDPARLTALLKEAVSTGCDQFITIKGSYNVWHASILMNSELGALKVPTFCDVPWTKLTALLPTTTNLQVFITDTKTLNEDEQNFLKGNIAVVDRIEELTEREMELSDNELEDESENDEEDDHYIPEPLQEKKRPFKVLRQSSILDDLPEDSSFSDKKIMNLYKQAPLNIIERSEMKVSDGKHVVLIVCGENGVTKEARKFVYDMYGEYVEHSELDVSAGQTGHSTLLDIVEQMKNED